MNKLIQPRMNNNPPSGVIGPRILLIPAIPFMSIVLNKYNEPENNNIPAVKNQAEYVSAGEFNLSAKIPNASKASA